MAISSLLSSIASLAHRNKKLRRARRLANSHLEPLEVRMLLSVVIAANGKSATYTDKNGDLVTFAITVGTLTGGNFTTAAEGLGDTLQVVDFSAGGFDNTNITVTVKRQGNGDGVTDVGYINSALHDLGTVTLPGDIGRIDAGDANAATPGIKSLKVRSMGLLGLDTQGGAGSLESNIVGLGSLTVTADVRNALVNVTGNLGNVAIGGSLIGGTAGNSGAIIAGGNIGNVKITGDVIGGDGANSGSIQSDEKMGSVTIGGSVIGGAGANTALILADDGDMGALKIGGDLRGGTGTNSGVIDAEGALASVTIGGSLIGGDGALGADSGLIFTDGKIGAIKIGGDIRGGEKNDSGEIDAGGDVASLTVGGSVVGGDGDSSGFIRGLGKYGAIKIGGSLIGGGGNDSGEITPAGDIASLSIGGSVLGGSGNDTGEIDPGGNLGATTIAGSIIGGSGNDSGEIDPDGDIASLKVGVDIRGGSGSVSGVVDPGGQLKTLTVGGSIIGGSGDTSGVINPGGALGTVTITRDLIGGSVSGVANLNTSGAILSQARINKITINGSIFAGVNSGAGTLTGSGWIQSANDIGSLTIKGSIIGNASMNVFITGHGSATPTATADVAIGAVTISGRVEYATFLAGYTTALVGNNGHAQMGALKVTGDWIASSILVGALVGGDDLIGTNDDVAIAAVGAPVASIAGITIGGQVLGTPDSLSNTDHFGFVARQIKSVKIGPATYVLNPADSTDNIDIGVTDDFTILEVA